MVDFYRPRRALRISSFLESYDNVPEEVAPFLARVYVDLLRGQYPTAFGRLDTWLGDERVAHLLAELGINGEPYGLEETA